MNFVKGIYYNGTVELIEKPKNQDFTEVIIIFPENQKSVKKIKGLYNKVKIDYDQVKRELKTLSKNSENHLLEESSHE